MMDIAVPLIMTEKQYNIPTPIKIPINPPQKIQ
jgi:hypothetical protein